LPNLASALEQVLADFEAPTWFAVFLPGGASEPIISKLNQAAFATADTPSVQERLNALAAPVHRGADFGG
jgi:tripartite-type tricarboxylate transporter receptor subunit TctC